MQILHLAATDRKGGAAIAAYRLHVGLQRRGFASRMLVGTKATRDPSVTEAKPDAVPLPDRVRRRLAANWLAREHQQYFQSQSPQLEAFSDDRVAGRDWLSERLPFADVYNLHWVAGFLDYRRFFARLPSYTPLVWTLHDMNPLTGGCHYSLGCDRFEKNCGACPLLGSTSENDLSAQIQRRKRLAVSACAAETTRIVVTSRWLKTQAQRSELLGKFPIVRIPHGLDTGVFSPRPRAVAREVFDLPQNDKIILFVSDSITNYRKGFDLLIPVLNALSESMPITLVAIGDGFTRDPSKRIAELGRIDNERILSFAYSAADVFVTPARAEAFGQVVFEAMACGTPVVAFDTGGIPDMVRPGITGVLAPAGNALALGEAIKTLLKDDQLRQRMSAQCRMIAVDEYSLDVQAARYASLYEALIEASDRSRRTSPLT